jgi:huntingtin-interacting protein 1-related protein
MLKHYEDQQAKLRAQQAEEKRRLAQQAEEEKARFEAMQRAQQEKEAREAEALRRQQEEEARRRLEQASLYGQQQQFAAQSQQLVGRIGELEREILAMRGQYERDQLMLDQYDKVRNVDFWSKDH